MYEIEIPLEPFKCPQIGLRNHTGYRSRVNANLKKKRWDTGVVIVDMTGEIGLEWTGEERTGLVKHGLVKHGLITTANF